MARNVVAFALLASCDGIGNPPADSETGTRNPDTAPTVDTDPTADTDENVDTDTAPVTESDTSATTTVVVPEGETAIRVVHAGAGFGPQDMVVNGNLPPVLDDLGYAEGTLYSERSPKLYTFQFKDGGDPLAAAWTTFDFELLDATRHSFVIFGPVDARAVLRLVDNDLGIGASDVRIRWTHVAPALPSVVDLYDLAREVPVHLGLGYGESVEIDQPAVETQLGVDVDGDAVADVKFDSFTRSAGEYFHVLLTNEVDGTTFLLGHTTDGATPRRDLVPN